MVDGELNFITKLDKTGFEKGKSAINNGIGNLKSSLKSLAKVAAAAFSVKMIYDYAKSSKEAYNVQIEQETKLATIMKQRMGATNDVVDSVKQLASEQQKLGVIGDEVQLAGAQQVATFLNEADSIKTLLPAMNDLLAQQNGLNATTSDAVNIGNMMGKVLQGQTSALKRVGISFSDAEEQVLKYGTESERAAMLAQVITNNVGHMNQALAQTDAGKQTQLANTMGDIKEQFGQAVQTIESVFVPVLARLVDWFGKVATAAQTVSTAIRSAFGVEQDNNSAAVAASTATSTAAAAESYGDIEKSAENTEKAQENSLASFDKVIKIGKSENSSAAAGGTNPAGTGGGQASMSLLPKNAKKTSWADELKKSIKSGNWEDLGAFFAKKINGVFGKVKWEKVRNKVVNGAKKISDGINGFVTNLNWNGIGSSIGNGITTAFTAAYTFLTGTKWASIGSGFAQLLNGIISNTSFDKVGRTLAAKTNAFIGLAWGFVKDFDFEGAGLGFADLINGWVDEFDASQLGDTISTAAKGILDFISISLKEIKWEKVGEKISDFINAIDWRGILESLFEVIGNLIKAMPQLLKGVITNLDFDNAAALFGILFAPKMAKKLLGVFQTDSSTKTDLTDAGKAAGSTVGDAFTGTAEKTGTGFANKLSSGLSAAGSVINAAITGWQIGTMIYNIAKPGIDKIIDDIQNIWNAAKDAEQTVKNNEAKSKKQAADVLKTWKSKGYTWLTTDDIQYHTDAYQRVREIDKQYQKYKDYGVTISDIKNETAKYQQAVAGKLAKINAEHIATTSEKIQQSKINAEIQKLKKQYSNLPSTVLEKMARANLGLPALAKGTVVPANYGNFAAILGDNKKEPEVVSPLSTMRQAVMEALAMQQGKQKQPIQINISLDTRNGKRLLTKQVIDDINDIIRSTGKVPINI